MPDYSKTLLAVGKGFRDACDAVRSAVYEAAKRACPKLVGSTVPVSEVVASLLEKAAEQPLASPWISVEDRLPDQCCNVLAWNPDEAPEVCHFIDGRFESYSDFTSKRTTHWMEIPEVPEGEQGGAIVCGVDAADAFTYAAHRMEIGVDVANLCCRANSKRRTLYG